MMPLSDTPRPARPVPSRPAVAPRPVSWALLSSLVLAAAAGCGPQPTPLARALPPEPGANVLVVSFDALRADRLGTYGYPRPTSPRIDAFAEEAVVFERAWSSAQATPTAFAAAFTGRWPSRVFHAWKLVPGAPTVAESFRAAGYHTRFLSAQVQLVPSRGFGRGFDSYSIVRPSAETDTDRDNVVDDEALLARFEAWLGEEAEGPFFAWVHFIAPHSPYRVRAGSEHLYDAAYEGRFAETTGHTFTVESPEELARVKDLYDGQVLFADRIFGRVLDTLEASGLADETLVVLTSDHGEELMEHGRLQHYSVFEEVIRVPLLIRHPRSPGALRTTLPVTQVDLFPTLAAIAGLETPGGFDGDSLLEPLPADRLVLATAMTHDVDNFVAAARGGDKAIVDCGGRAGSLYDLADDPGEMRDLVKERRRRYHELVDEVTERLGNEPCRAIAAALRGSSAADGLDDETRRGLMALGYLGGDGGGASDAGRSGLWAEPNPILACEGLRLGQTRLYWRFDEAPAEVEIRVEAPDGKLLAAVPPSGSLPTGAWVRDGMEFFAVDLASSRLLGRTSVAVTTDCSVAGEAP